MASTTIGRSEAIPISNKTGSASLDFTTSPAVESAVDAFATRVLQTRSPPEACVDGSLGPYVASIIRCSFSEASGIKNGIHDFDLENDVPEFESLMELLEEHCCMDPETAISALRNIAISVRTGIVDWHDDSETTYAGSFNLSYSFTSPMTIGSGNITGRRGRPFRSISLGNEHDYDPDMINNMLGQMLQESALNNSVKSDNHFELNGFKNHSPSSGGSSEPDLSFVLDEDIPFGASNDYVSANHSTLQSNEHEMLAGEKSYSYFPADDDYSESNSSPSRAECGTRNTSIFTPLKPDSLIPGDLLGVLDDPSTPAPRTDENTAEQKSDSSSDTGSSEVSSKNSRLGKGKKKSKEAANDLAAALFHTSRPRSNSNISDKSPKLKPMSGPPPGMLSLSQSPTRGVMNLGGSNLFQQQLNSTAQILLSMNPELGEEAASEAAMVSNADVNIAQYVIDGAMSAPPICRHMLNNACYRSDCQFSHDVEGHTCLFWLRGRCGKGEDTCRFMHGFSEKLLEGIKSEFLPNYHRSEEKEAVPFLIPPPASQSTKIQTTNLVQHNMRLSQSPSGRGQSLFPALSGVNNAKSGAGAGTYRPYCSLTSQENAYPTPGSHSVPDTAANGRMEVDKKKPVGSFASIASKGYSKNASFPGSMQGNGTVNSAAAPVVRPGANNFPKTEARVKFAKIPQELWNPCYNRDSGVFQIANPMERYNEVAMSQKRKDVIDLHFQSTKTFPVVLSQVLPEKLRSNREVWVVTGSGHHVNKNSHQRIGGVLENAVLSWLDAKKYTYVRGRDKNGHGGAVLVKR